jgi:predicted ATPase
VVTSVLDPDLRGAWYALQQPEVHLHPRAQAAMGDLLFDMALSPNDKRFFVETHSDYVVDRFRYRMRKAAEKGELAPHAQVLFFERAGGKNIVHPIPLAPDGEYPEAQPDGFRAFFLEEELRNLGY